MLLFLIIYFSLKRLKIVQIDLPVIAAKY